MCEKIFKEKRKITKDIKKNISLFFIPVIPQNSKNNIGFGNRAQSFTTPCYVNLDEIYFFFSFYILEREPIIFLPLYMLDQKTTIQICIVLR